MLLDCLHEDLFDQLAGHAFDRVLEVSCRHLYTSRGG